MARRTGSVEKMLISSVLRDRDWPTVMRAGIVPKMFVGYQDEWQWLFDYFNRFRKMPSVSVFKNQFTDFQLEPVNDTEHLCEELKTAAARRMMNAEMREAAEALKSSDMDAAISTMQKAVLSAASMLGVYNDGDILRDNDDVMTDFDDIRRRAEQDGLAGVPFGFPRYDRLTGGAKPGELITVAARLGEGKTFCMSKWAASAARSGFTVLYNSLEMPRSQMTARLLTFMKLEAMPFNSGDLILGQNYDPNTLKKYMKALRESIDGSLHVSDRAAGGVTPATVAAQIERVKPDIVFIDYIGLMQTRGEKNWASIGELSQQLKNLALTYGIPIVVASQLNRMAGIVKNGEPAGAEAIANSDQIGQDSDQVITLGRPSPSVRKFKMAKSRHGRDGFTWLAEFNPDQGVFRQIGKEDMLELKAQDAERRLLDDENDDDDDGE